jgi:uncharacterized membrane protein
LATFCYLIILIVVAQVFAVALNSSMVAIAMNQIMPALHCSSMNGLLSMLGASVAKGAGHMFVGLLVAVSLLSGVFFSICGHTTLTTLPFPTTIEHVKGYQDTNKRWDVLEIQAQINILAQQANAFYCKSPG